MSMLVARRKKEKSRPALSITVTKSTTKDESKKGSPTSAQLRHSKIKEKLKKFDTLEEILQKRNGTADDLKVVRCACTGSLWCRACCLWLLGCCCACPAVGKFFAFFCRRVGVVGLLWCATVLGL